MINSQVILKLTTLTIMIQLHLTLSVDSTLLLSVFFPQIYLFTAAAKAILLALKFVSSTDKFILWYRVVTSARSCNKVGHLFWFTILAQHETNDVILYIQSVHKHRGNSFQRQNYKMRLKQRSLN